MELYNQLLLTVGVVVVIYFVLFALMRIERKFFKSNKIQNAISKKSNSNVPRSKTRTLLLGGVLVVVFLIPVLYKYSCSDQCKVSIIKFFGNSQ